MTSGDHLHLCDLCGQEYHCPLVTHCKYGRPGFPAVCPACVDISNEQDDEDLRRFAEIERGNEVYRMRN